MNSNLRAMTESERRVGLKLQQDLFNTTGDFLARADVSRLSCHSIGVKDKALITRMRAAFQEYNQWLRR